MREILNLLKGRKIKCATVVHKNTRILLKSNYTDEDFNRFLNDLNFNYDSGYGVQELWGTVWFEDHSWAKRTVCDGGEWWKRYSLPEIPKELL